MAQSIQRRSKDLSKEEMYESVKTLIECRAPHIHLPQQKLFTLFSIAFNTVLYLSTKDPGQYIIRVEDSHLADKLLKKSKDETTRKFLARLVLPRRLKYQDSIFHLDYFHPGSWSMTKDIPQDRIKGAIIVKNTSNTPLKELLFDEETGKSLLENLPADYYLSFLTSFVPRTFTIAFEQDYAGLEKIVFPFIKDNEDSSPGVRVAADIDFTDID